MKLHLNTEAMKTIKFFLTIHPGKVAVAFSHRGAHRKREYPMTRTGICLKCHRCYMRIE